MMRILWVLLLGLGMSVAAWAQTVPQPAPAGSVAAPAPATAPAANPYSATVPVAGTSDAQRNAAIAAALGQVLQQVAPGFTPGADAQANAAGYVRDFHYRRAASGAGLELQVDFDPGAIGRLVAEGGASAVTTAPVAPAAGAQAAATPASAATVAPTAAAQVASSGTATVWIGGLDSSHAFASALALLRGDPQLHDVIPLAADGDGVMLQVGYSQPLAGVLAALATPNGHLTPAPQPHPGASMALQWTP